MVSNALLRVHANPLFPA